MQLDKKSQENFKEMHDAKLNFKKQSQDQSQLNLDLKKAIERLEDDKIKQKKTLENQNREIVGAREKIKELVYQH